MISPKVSVIIPVYNTEKFLKEAIESICNQTLRDIEIIVVDDGSTDNSKLVIEAFSQIDCRIKVIHQANQGQSVARNVGLDIARGEFIYFMDSDDIIDINALLICYNKCIEKNLNIILFDAEIFSEDQSDVALGYNYLRKGKIAERVYTGVEMLEIQLNINMYRAAPWLFFVRRDLIDRLSLRFFPGIIHEDELFMPLLFIAAERVYYIPKTFFYRRVRGNSTMTNNFSKKNIYGYITVVKELKAFSEHKNNRVKAVIKKLIGGIINSVAYQGGTLSSKERYELLWLLIKNGYIFNSKLKSTTVLLIPSVIKVKSKFKSIFN